MSTPTTANPYPGLRPFGKDDSEIFFGRQDDLEELLTRIFSTRFLAVLGASGTGKSSLIRAALVPVLQRGRTAADHPEWLVCEMRPQGDPFEQLAAGLAATEVFGGALSQNAAAESLPRLLMEGPRSLIVLAQAILEDQQRLLIFVDQFEELFRYRNALANQSTQLDEAGSFVDLLVESVSQLDVPIYVLITMRAEYLSSCSEFPYLAQKITDGFFLLGNMSREQMRQAIVEPAEQQGVSISDPLVSQILNDLARARDPLPSMQHTMMRMWERYVAGSADAPRVLERNDHYREGLVLVSIGEHAKEVFDNLSIDGRAAAEVLFKAITTMDSQNETIRNPATVAQICRHAAQLCEEIRAVIECFRDPNVSMLRPSLSESPLLSDETMIDISHESLVRQWKTLRDWAKEEAEANKPLTWIAEDAKFWDEKGRNSGYLTSGQRLVEMGRWLRRGDDRLQRLTPLEQEFMAQCLGETALSWLDDYEDLRSKADEWQRQGRSKALLLRGKSLDNAVRWHKEQSGADGRSVRATRLQQEYIDASRKQSWKRILFSAGAGAVAVVVVLLMFAWQQNVNRSRSVSLAQMATATSQNEFQATAYRIWLAQLALEYDSNEETKKALPAALSWVLSGRPMLKHATRLQATGPLRDLRLSLDGNSLDDSAPESQRKFWDATSGARVAGTLNPAFVPALRPANAYDSGGNGSSEGGSAVPGDVSSLPANRPPSRETCGYRFAHRPAAPLAQSSFCFPAQPTSLLVSPDGRYVGAVLGQSVQVRDSQQPDSELRFPPLNANASVAQWGFIADSGGSRSGFIFLTTEGDLWVHFLPGEPGQPPINIPAVGGRHLSASISWDAASAHVVSVGADAVVRKWATSEYSDYPSKDAPSRGYKTVAPSFDEKDRRWTRGDPNITKSLDGCCQLHSDDRGVRYVAAGIPGDCSISHKSGQGFVPLSGSRGVLAFDADGKSFQLWDSRCKKLPAPGGRSDELIHEIFENGQGTGFATLAADRAISLWKIDSGKISKAGDPIRNVKAAKVSPDGRYLLMYDSNGLEYLSLNEVMPERTVRPLPLPADADLNRALPDFKPALFFSPNADRLGVVFPGSKAFIAMLTKAGFADPVPIPLDARRLAKIERMFFDFEGKYLGTINTDESVSIWEHSENRVAEKKVFAEGATQCRSMASSGEGRPPFWVTGAFSRDNAQFAVERRDDGALRAYNLNLQTIEGQKEIDVLLLNTLPRDEAKACRKSLSHEDCRTEFRNAWLGVTPADAP